LITGIQKCKNPGFTAVCIREQIINQSDGWRDIICDAKEMYSGIDDVSGVFFFGEAMMQVKYRPNHRKPHEIHERLRAKF
jgi:hypothetical protein